MSKLTKAQRRILESAHYNMQRARKYLYADTTAVCRRIDARGGTTLDYRREDGKGMSEVTREYGSDLCGLDTAIRDIQNILNN